VKIEKTRKNRRFGKKRLRKEPSILNLFPPGIDLVRPIFRKGPQRIGVVIGGALLAENDHETWEID